MAVANMYCHREFEEIQRIIENAQTSEHDGFSKTAVLNLREAKKEIDKLVKILSNK